MKLISLQSERSDPTANLRGKRVLRSRPTRRSRRWVLPVGLAALLLAACSGPPANVLIVTFDTTRYDRFGCTGDPEARTPVVDALAERGLLFDHSYASVPLTLPAHTSIMTGLEPLAHGVHNNGKFRVPGELNTLAEILGDAGYQTAAFVSAFVLDRRYNLAQGFEVYGAEVPRSSDVLDMTVAQRPGAQVTDEALGWLKQRRRDAPFFLWAHYYDPHLPRRLTPPFDAIHDGYRAEIAYADAQLGRLLEGVAGAPTGRETLIVFTSDHGESLDEHGEKTHGILACDSTLRVPLILAGPGVPANERTDVMARQIDLLPTILQAVGLPVPDGLPGRDLLRAAALGDPRPDDVVGYFESRGPELDLGWAPIEGVRAGRWKYTALPAPAELYDVFADPLSRLPRPEFESRIQDQELDLDELEQLAALGYIDARASFAPGEEPDPRRFAGVHSWVSQARGMASRGRYQAAIDVLETLVESPSVRPLVLRSLAPVYLEAGRLEDAIGAYRRYIELTDAPEARYGLARALVRMDRAEEAIAVLDELPASARQAQLLRAGALLQLGRHEEARSAVDAAFPAQERRRLHARSNLVLKVAPLPDGEPELRSLLAAAPEDALLRSRLGFYLALWGAADQRDEALALLREAAASAPDREEIQANLGWCAYRLGLPEEAVEALEAAIATGEASHQDRARLGAALAAAGEVERARETLRRVLAERPAAPWSDKVRAILEELEAGTPAVAAPGAGS
jgi:arylsulfatase A-like enzyme/thioredoxin-like negative regulator of GroEL